MQIDADQIVNSKIFANITATLFAKFAISMKISVQIMTFKYLGEKNFPPKQASNASKMQEIATPKTFCQQKVHESSWFL